MPMSRSLRRAGRSLTARAYAAHSLAGVHVDVQLRFHRSPWRTVRRLELDAEGSTRFGLSKGGWKVRVFMPTPEAGPGYVAGFSRALSL